MPVTTTHRQIKTTLRAALADTALFDDAHLVALLEKARNGQVTYRDCDRCLIGLSNNGYYNGYYSDYFAGGAMPPPMLSDNEVERLETIEYAFSELANEDAQRRARLIPLILREIRTRSRQPTGRTAQLSMVPSMAPATKFQMVD